MYPRRTPSSPAPRTPAASPRPRVPACRRPPLPPSRPLPLSHRLLPTARRLPPTARPAFTLIELLIVIGIILVLIGIVVIGLRHVNSAVARHETETELKICQDMLKEYENVNGLKNIDDAVPSPAPSPTMLPSQLSYIYSAGLLLPVFVEQPQGTTTEIIGQQPGAQSSAVQLTDLQSTSGGGPSGFGDMSSHFAAEARYTSPVVRNTQVVMYLILKDPKNRATLLAIPPRRILESAPSTDPSIPTPPPNPIDAAVVLDGWGNPIVFVPRGGVHVAMDPSNAGAANPGPITEFLIRSSGIRNVTSNKTIPAPSPADRPFFMSAGQDGYFTDPAQLVDYASDNLYSFQEQ